MVFVVVFVGLFFFFPKRMRGQRKKSKRKKIYGVLCLEPNGGMFMLNSLCSEICFTAVLSAFCLCGLSSERRFASVSHKAKDKLKMLWKMSKEETHRDGERYCE